MFVNIFKRNSRLISVSFRTCLKYRVSLFRSACQKCMNNACASSVWLKLGKNATETYALLLETARRVVRRPTSGLNVSGTFGGQLKTIRASRKATARQQSSKLELRDSSKELSKRPLGPLHGGEYFERDIFERYACNLILVFNKYKIPELFGTVPTLYATITRLRFSDFFVEKFKIFWYLK